MAGGPDPLSDRPGEEGKGMDVLADVLLVHALRAHVGAGCGWPPGWLRGLADERVSAALKAMHAEPEAPWTVASLARVAAVSRSAFAARFKAVVGQAPLAYLTWWR